MSEAGYDDGTPEFHLVVRRRNGRGPLAPYRLALAVAFALAAAGRDLWAALHGRADVDAALLRAGVAALLVWVVAGAVDNVLAAGTPPRRGGGGDAPPAA